MAAAAAADAQSSQVLKVLARGLEKNQTSTPLWLLYLHCYSKRVGTSVAVKIGEPLNHIAQLLADSGPWVRSEGMSRSECNIHA